jgi:hypothetical protein
MKKILLASIAALGMFSTVLTSCKSDPCDPSTIVCKNNATCLEGVCQCTSGFEGTNCEILSLSKFLKPGNAPQVYSFRDSVNPTSVFTGDLTITQNALDSTKLNITNIGGFLTTAYAVGVVGGNTLSIPSQQLINASTITVVGSGVYNTGIIKGTYDSKDATGTVVNYFTWTKK